MCGADLRRVLAAVASGSVALGSALALAQDKAPDLPPEVVANQSPAHDLGHEPSEIDQINVLTGMGSDLLEVPLVNLTPGAVPIAGMANPMADDPSSAMRGKKYFTSFNCSGCHAPDGGGGMGPSLSNSIFKFGSDPAHLYLVISHGMPLGMPSWGGFLPDNVIWDLVSYVEAISKQPTGPWGITASVPAGLPALEQVPAEFKSEIAPWDYVEPFSFGEKPTKATPTTGPNMPLIPGEPHY